MSRKRKYHDGMLVSPRMTFEDFQVFVDFLLEKGFEIKIPEEHKISEHYYYILQAPMELCLQKGEFVTTTGLDYKEFCNNRLNPLFNNLQAWEFGRSVLFLLWIDLTLQKLMNLNF